MRSAFDDSAASFDPPMGEETRIGSDCRPRVTPACRKSLIAFRDEGVFRDRTVCRRFPTGTKITGRVAPHPVLLPVAMFLIRKSLTLKRLLLGSTTARTHCTLNIPAKMGGMCYPTSPKIYACL